MFKSGDEPIAGYRLVRFRGRGQFGQVWECSTPGGARAALKFIDLGGAEGRKELRAVQRVRAIRHPHLMPITALWLLDEQGRVIDGDAAALTDQRGANGLTGTMSPSGAHDDSDGPRWLVIAQVLGDKTLGDLLAELQLQGLTGIPAPTLLRYMDEIAKGLDFLNSAVHAAGNGLVAVQHCDVKPDNILLVGDSVLICDFGLAHVLSAGVSKTATAMAGSPAYMAPECIARKPSSASDQYSCAVMYTHLRTGQLPFASDSFLDVLDAHRQGKLEFSKLQGAERAVIRKATSVDPRRRYPSVQALAAALRAAVWQTEDAARPWARLGKFVAAIAAKWRWKTGKSAATNISSAIRPSTQSAAVAAPLPSDRGLTMATGEAVPDWRLLAQVDKGFFMYRGLGAPKDAAKAYACFRQAASAGNKVALNNLGIMLIRGEGASVDIERGVDCLWQAAILGYDRALHNLTHIYRMGRGPCRRNDSLAFQLASLAADDVTPAAKKQRLMALQRRESRKCATASCA